MIKIMHSEVPNSDFAKYWGNAFISKKQMLWISICEIQQCVSRLKNVLKYIENYCHVNETINIFLKARVKVP